MPEIVTIQNDDGKFIRYDFMEDGKVIGQSYFKVNDKFESTLANGTAYWYNDYGWIKVKDGLKHCDDGPAENFVGIKNYCLYGEYVTSEFAKWCKERNLPETDENFSIFSFEYSIKYYKKG